MRDNKNPSRDYWNKDDLKIYILLYCANADLVLKKEEQEYINQKIYSAKFDAICKEFENDNDYQSITKIVESVNHLGCTKEQMEQLVLELKELFWSDGKFDHMEKAILRRLMHILNY